jgi:hypothetical protein
MTTGAGVVTLSVMDPDLPVFYQTAATLSPVLLIAVVAGMRLRIAAAPFWLRALFMAFLVLPGNLVMIYSITALAFGSMDSVLWVVIPLSLQVGAAVGAFSFAFLLPQHHEDD